jgi:transglutaminase-like putative cysteine protease
MTCRTRAWLLPGALALFALAGLGAVRADAPAVKKEAPKSRTFDLTYTATIKDLPAGKKVRIWAPVPSSSDDQDVTWQRTEVAAGTPTTGKTQKEARYGNQVWYAEATADPLGQVTVTFQYRVTRREVKGQTGIKYKDDAARIKRYLEGDALVPIKGRPLDLIKDRKLPADPTKKARVLYDVVNDHMKYSKEGTGWGRGDAVWACDSKYGNCSDFHSLFISLTRAQKIPAKFEIGLPLPEKRGAGTIGGYHCWAFFNPDGKAWVPVDISEANKAPKLKDYYFGNLTEDRVTFSVGRDIELVPKQQGKALNYFIYPHVEVDGKEHPQAKIDKKYTFKDVAK